MHLILDSVGYRLEGVAVEGWTEMPFISSGQNALDKGRAVSQKVRRKERSRKQLQEAREQSEQRGRKLSVTYWTNKLVCSKMD